MADEPAVTGELVSITEAARRLTAAGVEIDRSTLSRYIKQHAEALPLTARGKENLVDFDALVAHRGENVRLRDIPARTAGLPPGVQPGRFAGSQSEGVARKANADAEMREMDLAQRRQRLTPTAEVDQAGRDAIALMQSAFERAIETEAATLSVKYGWDERIARIELKRFVRIGLEVFNREILERLDSKARERLADEVEPGQRIETLAKLQ